MPRDLYICGICGAEVSPNWGFLSAIDLDTLSQERLPGEGLLTFFERTKIGHARVCDEIRFRRALLYAQRAAKVTEQAKQEDSARIEAAVGTLLQLEEGSKLSEPAAVPAVRKGLSIHARRVL